jgi:hypothetical protein
MRGDSASPRSSPAALAKTLRRPLVAGWKILRRRWPDLLCAVVYGYMAVTRGDRSDAVAHGLLVVAYLAR